VWAHATYEGVEEEVHPFSLLGIEPRLLGCPALSLAIIYTGLFWLRSSYREV